MPRIARLGLLLLIATATVWSGYAEGSEKVCAGTLTDMRVIGVTLGDCDLNSISENQLKQIMDICGEPKGVDDSSETKCLISAIASPHKFIPPEHHGYGAPVYVVQKVLKVEKR
jgi:hypothetical protein